MRNIQVLCVILFLICSSSFSMEQRQVIDQKDNGVTEDQKNKLIEKYSASTWQEDFQYANAVIVSLTFPGEAYYKDVMDRQWWEKHKELIERGLDKEAINIIEDEFFKHKYKVTKRVGSCCMGLLITAVIVGLDQCLGLF